MKRERRLVFGEVAELYDRYRPAYPRQLVDDLVHLAGLDDQRAALEVGAGTGKATAMFAARGIPVLGLEPSAEMARVARRNCAAYGGVEIVEREFEAWDPLGQRFPLVYSAQAWHWVQHDVGLTKAALVLSDGGVLAPFWNRPVWASTPLREVLLRAYRRAAPHLSAEDDLMHPGSSQPDDDQPWNDEIAATEGLTGAEVRYYEWSHRYSAHEYSRLLETHSAVRILDEERRGALLAAVANAIETNGNELILPMVTRLCLARRTPR